MEEKKETLIEALARAVSDLERENNDKEVENLGTTFELSLVDLKKWVDVESSNKYAVLT
eukprot:CAMPEP_0172423942 /NCGR_PEP_ID=MMETSP1064-20121228/19664_1 /TAXON_ID=202472 /ORGANISM="Aulacoseira subarctica , Strain CCAP 1002/5" /LENGTH=58 /DNA_ID=CAMNT_0013165571 /DNA_START=125 /DNA_END=301 /DNA_ORIENTATION=-